MIGVEDIYLPRTVAWSLRHLDEIEVDARADIESSLARLPVPDSELLKLYAIGYSAREALKLMNLRGDPHKRFRAALNALVMLMNGGNEIEPDRTDRPAVVGEDDIGA